MSTIAVKHNIEVAHRLFEMPGKCQQIHGHSMWVTLFIEGQLNSKGILGGIEFGELKKLFREHLDTNYDHRLLLNTKDPWAQPLGPYGTPKEHYLHLPGLNSTRGDPTTENIAYWVHDWASGMMAEHFSLSYAKVQQVQVWETSVNMAGSS